MELAVVQWAYSLHNPTLDRIMLTITGLGNLGMLWIVLTTPLLLNRRTRKWGFVCLVAMMLTFLSGNVLLKNIIARPRPYTNLPEIALLIPTPSDWSFPSGHTSISFACALSVWFWNKKLGVGLLVLAALIAFSRLYLIVHYPSDLLAGALLGVGCAFLARYLVGKKYNLSSR